MKVAVAGSGVALALIWGCSTAPSGSGANDDRGAGGGANIADSHDGADKQSDDEIELTVPTQDGDDKVSTDPQGAGDQQADDLVDQGDSQDPVDQVAGGENDQTHIADQKRQGEAQEGGADREIVDQASVEQAGVEQAGVEQAGVEQAGVDQAGVDQAGVDQAGVDQAGVEQAGVDQAGVEQGRVDQGDGDAEQQSRPELVQYVRHMLAQDNGKDIVVQELSERFAAIRTSLERFADDAARTPFTERVGSLHEKIAKLADIQPEQLETVAVELYRNVEKLEKDIVPHSEMR